MDAAERRTAAFVGRRIPIAEIRAGGDTEIPDEARLGAAVAGNAAFAPRRGNDRLFDKIALNAVVLRRLVMLVEKSQRNEHQTGAHAVVVAQRVFDIELLDFRLALIDVRRNGMLPFQFAVYARRFVEFVIEADHGAGEIGDGVGRVARRMVVVDLAVAPKCRVAAERDTRIRHAGSWIRGSDAGRRHVRGRLRRRCRGLLHRRAGRRRTLVVHLTNFVLQRRHFGFQRVDFRFQRGIVRECGRGKRCAESQRSRRRLRASKVFRRDHSFLHLYTFVLLRDRRNVTRRIGGVGRGVVAVGQRFQERHHIVDFVFG